MKRLERIVTRFIVFIMVMTIMSTDSVAQSGSISSVKVMNVSSGTLVLAKGKTFKLKVKVSARGKVNKNVEFKSSQPKVVRVSSAGSLLALKKGAVRVIAWAKANKKKKAVITVKVGQPVTKVILNKKSLSLETGESATLKAIVKPKKALYKKVKWSSSHKAVAQVSNKSKITAVKAGTAKITAQAMDGSGMKATCKVTVRNKAIAVTTKAHQHIPVEIIEMNSPAYLEVGKEETLQVSVKPDEASNKRVSFSSSDENVLAVDQYGKVKGMKAGEAALTITAADGSGVFTQKVVKVIDPLQALHVLSDTDKISVGYTAQLAVSPDPASAVISHITYQSSDEKIATVDETGKVTGVGNGDVEITITASDDYGHSVIDKKTITVRTNTTDGKAFVQACDEAHDNILFIGNSLTLHGYASFWWSDDRGMAASAKDKDYVHLTVSALATKQSLPVNAYAINYAGWEKATDRASTYDQIEPYLNAQLNDVVIQLGENITTTQTMGADYEKLIDYIRLKAPKAKIVLIGEFWPDVNKETVKKEVAAKKGVSYVDLSAIWNNSSYQAGMGTLVSGNDGQMHAINYDAVAIHPNDDGMKYIADALIAKL